MEDKLTEDLWKLRDPQFHSPLGASLLQLYEGLEQESLYSSILLRGQCKSGKVESVCIESMPWNPRKAFIVWSPFPSEREGNNKKVAGALGIRER